ncbi:MAG: thioredoxin family protein, partial [Planctomycetota bacterium]
MTNGAHPAGGFTEPEWAAAIPWGAYLDGIEKKRDLWEANARRVRLAPEAIARLEHLPGRRRVLVLTADWCGDAARIVPVLGRAFEAASDVEARFLDTDAHPAVLSRNLTHGGRSIPLAIVQDESGRELGT